MKLLINSLTIFFLMIGANSHADKALSEQELYSIFDQVNGFDIETASLGVTQSDNRAVRALAAMVLRDHSMVIQMTRDSAKQQNITYNVDHTNASAKSHQEKIKELRSLSGEEFDKAYLNHEIKFHSSAIDAVKTILIPAAKGSELEAILKAVLPGFEHHLAESKKLASDIGAM